MKKFMIKLLLKVLINDFILFYFILFYFIFCIYYFSAMFLNIFQQKIDDDKRI